MKRVAVLVVLAMLLGGCGAPLTKLLEWSPITGYDAPELRDLVGEDRPLELFAEDSAPWHGWLLTDEDWRRIRAELDRREREIGRLQGQIRDDREYASTVDRAKVSAIEECRRGQWRAFSAGIGVGAGGCAALDRAIDASR